MNVLSIVHVDWRCGEPSVTPLFPLPYRTKKGTIYFPPEGEGYYMLDEVLAAIEFAEIEPGRTPRLIFLEAWEFVPGNDEKPFAFVQEIFDERPRITAETKEAVAQWKANGEKGVKPYNIMEKILKLGLNALYGKLAQKMGGRNGDPPKTVNPWYAAHITAAVRAQLLRASMRNIDDIVMFATDGVVSKVPLPVDCPAVKTLGQWETGTHEDGGTFVHSGIYMFDGKAKSRGINPKFTVSEDEYEKLGQDKVIEKLIVEEIIPRWKKGVATLEHAYRPYLTIGAASASPELYKLAGHWIETTRNLDLDRSAVKRERCPAKGRATRLLKTQAAKLPPSEIGCISAIAQVDWIDKAYALDKEIGDDQKEIDR